MEGSAAAGGGGGGGVESKTKKEESLPPGFRFHPTDEELITYYLRNKIADGSFTARAIAEVDLNKCEPWDLPEKAKLGEKEWYFFSLRDRKYPTGVRTNRATNAGYWKTTGKDKEIYSAQQLPAATTPELAGMKKTLVFYKGRAPRGEKTNWVMHEYRLNSKSVPKSNKDEWVVCRVFAKSAGAKKYPSSNNAHARAHHHHPYALDMVPPLLPALLQHDPFARHHPYMTPADLAELARFARGTPGLHPHIQPHPGTSAAAAYMNPAAAAVAAPFTLSGGGGGGGLNLNLGASPVVPPPPAAAAFHAMSMGMGGQTAPSTAGSHHHHHHQTVMTAGEHHHHQQQQQMAAAAAGLGGGCVVVPGADGGGFGGDAAGGRYQSLDVEQLVERYWPAAGYQV